MVLKLFTYMLFATKRREKKKKRKEPEECFSCDSSTEILQPDPKNKKGNFTLNIYKRKILEKQVTIYLSKKMEKNLFTTKSSFTIVTAIG